MRKAVLFLKVPTTSKRMTLTLFAVSLVGIALLCGVGIRSAETQTALSYYEVQALGTLSGQNSCQPYSKPYGINDLGHVVGESPLGGCYEGSIIHAFLYKDGQMKDLNTLMGIDSSFYTIATDINDSGQIVGNDYNSNWEPHAFLYDSTNGMKDLGTLGGSGSSASAV